MQTMVNIYVLQLEKGKYYVGKTDHTFRRFNQHVSGEGAKWTQKYAVKDLFEFHKDMVGADENRITLLMMREYGIENVRGGSWTQIKLPKERVKSLKRRINGRKRTKLKHNQKCTKCGRNSHVTKNCYARTHMNGKRIKRDRKIIDLSYYSNRITTKSDEKKKELETLRLQAEAEKNNLEEYERLAEEKKLLEEELVNLNTASKETNQFNMMRILEMLSEDDIGFIDDILSWSENYIEKIANQLIKDTKNQFKKLFK